MKLDPNACRVERREVLAWAVVHDLIAHPLLALGCYTRPVRWLHDATSALAWPRTLPGRGTRKDWDY